MKLYVTPSPPKSFTTRQFWSIEGKTEGSESLPYGRKTHKTVKVSSREPEIKGEGLQDNTNTSYCMPIVLPESYNL